MQVVRCVPVDISHLEENVSLTCGDGVIPVRGEEDEGRKGGGEDKKMGRKRKGREQKEMGRNGRNENEKWNTSVPEILIFPSIALFRAYFLSNVNRG
jgi:hypothetical protein